MALRLGMVALSAAHHADPEHEAADGAFGVGVGASGAQANGDLTTATAAVTHLVCRKKNQNSLSQINQYYILKALKCFHKANYVSY